MFEYASAFIADDYETRWRKILGCLNYLVTLWAIFKVFNNLCRLFFQYARDVSSFAVSPKFAVATFLIYVFYFQTLGS